MCLCSKIALRWTDCKRFHISCGRRSANICKVTEMTGLRMAARRSSVEMSAAVSRNKVDNAHAHKQVNSVSAQDRHASL